MKRKGSIQEERISWLLPSPLSFSLFGLPSLSLTCSLPPHFTSSLSLSLFITSLFLRLLPLPHWAAKELIAMCVSLSFVCVFEMVSRGCKRSRGFSTPHHLAYLLSLSPPPPPISFAHLQVMCFTQEHRGVMFTRSSFKCIINGMTGSGIPDGIKGYCAYLCVCVCVCL